MMDFAASQAGITGCDDSDKCWGITAKRGARANDIWI
jgi:hypothetical protein